MSQSANIAIHYALKVLAVKDIEQAIEFLDLWDQGYFEIIKQKWKDVPEEVFNIYEKINIKNAKYYVDLTFQNLSSRLSLKGLLTKVEEEVEEASKQGLFDTIVNASDCHNEILKQVCAILKHKGFKVGIQTQKGHPIFPECMLHLKWGPLE